MKTWALSYWIATLYQVIIITNGDIHARHSHCCPCRLLCYCPHTKRRSGIHMQYKFVMELSVYKYKNKGKNEMVGSTAIDKPPLNAACNWRQSNCGTAGGRQWRWAVLFEQLQQANDNVTKKKIPQQKQQLSITTKIRNEAHRFAGVLNFECSIGNKRTRAHANRLLTLAKN